MHTYPNVADLVHQQAPDTGDPGLDDDYSDYADWTDASEEVEPYPHQLELNEAARQQKALLDTRMEGLLERLASDEVRGKGYSSPGGEAEVVSEMRKLQLEELPKIYADVRYESGYLQWHEVQETPDWCQLACVQNAFRALGDESVTQGEIARETRTHRQGRAFPDHVMEFVRGKEFEVEKMDSATAMIDALAGGSKVVLQTGYPVMPMQHSILVSGVRIDRGKIDFIYNDPALDEGAQTVPLDRMLRLLEPPLAHNKLNRSYAISRSEAV